MLSDHIHNNDIKYETSEFENKLLVSDIENLWIIFAMFSGIIMGGSIGYLFFYQISNISKNLTTVEELITSKIKANPIFDHKSEK